MHVSRATSQAAQQRRVVTVLTLPALAGADAAESLCSDSGGALSRLCFATPLSRGRSLPCKGLPSAEQIFGLHRRTAQHDIPAAWSCLGSLASSHSETNGWMARLREGGAEVDQIIFSFLSTLTNQPCDSDSTRPFRMYRSRRMSRRPSQDVMVLMCVIVLLWQCDSQVLSMTAANDCAGAERFFPCYSG